MALLWAHSVYVCLFFRLCECIMVLFNFIWTYILFIPLRLTKIKCLCESLLNINSCCSIAGISHALHNWYFVVQMLTGTCALYRPCFVVSCTELIWNCSLIRLESIVVRSPWYWSDVIGVVTGIFLLLCTIYCKSMLLFLIYLCLRLWGLVDWVVQW